MALDCNTSARPPFHRGARKLDPVRPGHGKRAARLFGVRPSIGSG
ncbi:hypothetical protein FM111_14015 [Brevundimonas diminuta 3F5N]|uniref:Uncharacterized protein n=1 Tax=Brevundimonas diminuta 3F5N TaxID=1255603 RepID=A0A1R4GMH1_BREDI|nr:hypothetical protein FM111_14015 [Brevundimonas diminuta 3F5N]